MVTTEAATGKGPPSVRGRLPGISSGGARCAIGAHGVGAKREALTPYPKTVRPVQEPMGPRGVKSGSLSRTIELEPFLSPWPRQSHRAKSLGPFPWDAGPHYRDTRRGWHRAYCHLVVDNCLAGSVKVKIKSCCEAKLTLLAHRTPGSFLPLCHILSLFLRLSLTICFSLRSIKSSFSLSLDIDNVS